jgi:negative regulator of sigma E activity
MSNEELDSQLSAMFDDELPATECELLARRLARDEQLRERWGRYAAIGACIRGERGVRVTTALASEVSAAIRQETGMAGTAAARSRRGFSNPLVTTFGGLASAAAVAAVAILWMRSEGPTRVAQAPPVAHPADATPAAAAPIRTASELVASDVPPRAAAPSATARHGSREPDSYVVPTNATQGPVLVPPTDLANYIVAHSAYSGPLMRPSALSALVAGDSGVPQATAQPVDAVVTGK